MWSATMFTSHTTNGDIWHMWFFLLRADGSYVTARNLDSPLMTRRYADYTCDLATPTVMPRDQFGAATQIEWMGSC
jgi:hypothetical protein